MQLTLGDATAENATLVGWLSSTLAIRPKLQHGAPNDDIMHAVHEIAKDVNSVNRGEFLSRVCRLPDVWRNALLEYIQGSKPYDRLGFICHSTLQNQGNASVQLVAAVAQIPMRDPGTGMPDDRWENVATRVILAPGEDIELPSDRAVNSLWKFSPNAMNPHRWQNEGGSRTQRHLIEVAYRAEWQDRDTGAARKVRGYDPEWKAARLEDVKNIVEEAKKLKTKDGSEALRLLNAVADHWPRPSSFGTLLDKLEEAEAQSVIETSHTVPAASTGIPQSPAIGARG